MKKCIDCLYLSYYGTGIRAGWRCSHPKVYGSAKNYENIKREKIVKSVDFIGCKLPKTSLRWCPYKMEKLVK